MSKPGDETIRVFICIDVPSSIKERIDALQRELRRIDAQVGWVKADNIHLTLKFLGDVAASRIGTLHDAIERAARDVARIEVVVSGAGCFPSGRSPRVLWIGLTHVPESLAVLHKRIEDELAGEGFPREGKSFSPHLTIGRVRAPRNGPRLADALASSGFDQESFQAAEVIVMRSDLKPGGSIYSPLAAIKLGNE